MSGVLQEPARQRTARAHGLEVDRTPTSLLLARCGPYALRGGPHVLRFVFALSLLASSPAWSDPTTPRGTAQDGAAAERLAARVDPESEASRKSPTPASKRGADAEGPPADRPAAATKPRQRGDAPLAQLGLSEAIKHRGPWGPTHTIIRLEFAGSEAAYTLDEPPTVTGGWARDGDRLELRYRVGERDERVLCEYTEFGMIIDLVCGKEGGRGFVRTSYSWSETANQISLKALDDPKDLDRGVLTRIDVRRN